jgi:hypothetical protein
MSSVYFERDKSTVEPIGHASVAELQNLASITPDLLELRSSALCEHCTTSRALFSFWLVDVWLTFLVSLAAAADSPNAPSKTTAFTTLLS